MTATCKTPGCDGRMDDGEGQDGYCGNCADRRARPAVSDDVKDALRVLSLSIVTAVNRITGDQDSITMHEDHQQEVIDEVLRDVVHYVRTADRELWEFMDFAEEAPEP